MAEVGSGGQSLAEVQICWPVLIEIGRDGERRAEMDRVKQSLACVGRCWHMLSEVGRGGLMRAEVIRGGKVLEEEGIRWSRQPMLA